MKAKFLLSDVWRANAMHIGFHSGQRVSWKSWVFAVVFMLVIAFGGRIYMVFELENECLRTQSNCAAAAELRNNWWKLWHTVHVDRRRGF